MGIKKEIYFAPGYYAVKNGLIFSKQNPDKPLKAKTEKNGYKRVTLIINNERKMFSVHRIIALCFLQKINGKEYINHKDNDKSNNDVSNLEWCTQSENIHYAYRKGYKVAPHQKIVINTETGIFYDSQKKAADAHNINPATLCLWLNNKFTNKSNLKYA